VAVWCFGGDQWALSAKKDVLGAIEALGRSDIRVSRFLSAERKVKDFELNVDICLKVITA
jgi:hypothetical protein